MLRREWKRDDRPKDTTAWRILKLFVERERILLMGLRVNSSTSMQSCVKFAEACHVEIYQIMKHILFQTRCRFIK